MNILLSQIEMNSNPQIPINQTPQDGGIPHHPNTDWVISMEEKIKSLPKLLKKSAGRKECCIFRVPQSLVKINEGAYLPHIVSIGPYHHGKQHLKMIEEHKWRFLGSLLERTKNHEVTLNDLTSSIEPMEGKIRESYSETIEFTSSELITMMVLDGCFIVELFCKVGKLVSIDEDDPIFNVVWVRSFLMRDLLRLENQIPYFVLQTLFELSVSASRQEKLPSLTKLALEFFNYAVQRDDKVLERYSSLQGAHILDVFHMSYVPSEETTEARDTSPSLSPQLIQSAKKLHLAGVRFKPRKTDSFLEVKFKNGELQIPTLTIDDFFSSVFLNFIAFEQCYNHCSKHITTYATFMGCLINTPSDAGFLCDHKIIENYFGTDQEVASFFSDVGKDVVFDINRSYLAKLFEDVNEYYRNDWHVRWAGFRHKYFDTPWSFTSALAGIVLLLLTFIQAFFAVYAYVLPAKS